MPPWSALGGAGALRRGEDAADGVSEGALTEMSDATSDTSLSAMSKYMCVVCVCESCACSGCMAITASNESSGSATWAVRGGAHRNSAIHAVHSTWFRKRWSIDVGGSGDTSNGRRQLFCHGTWILLLLLLVLVQAMLTLFAGVL